MTTNSILQKPLVRRRFVDVEQGQIHLREAGCSNVEPTLVCLHMVPKSSRSFANILPELSNNRRCLAIDYPGYGESSSLTSEPSIDDFSQSILAVLDILGIEQFDILGHHTGSMVGANLAFKAPERARKLIGISAPIFTDKEIGEFHAHYAPVPLDTQGSRFNQMWQRILYHRGPGMTLEMAATSLAENLRGGERYEDGHQAAFEFSPRYAELLSELSLPIWIMNFNDDLMEHSRRAQALIRNGGITDFQQFAHGSLDVYPQQLAKIMLRFLDGGEMLNHE